MNLSDSLKVIVTGSGNSGSGAIYDDLGGRPDFIKPFNQEFRLAADPGGLTDLYASLCFGFHLNRASSAMAEFIDFCRRCGRGRGERPRGLGYGEMIDQFDEKVEQFVEKITEVSYRGMPFCERSKMTPWQSWWFERRFEKAKERGEKYQEGTMRLPVERQEFLLQAQRFVESLLAGTSPVKEAAGKDGGLPNFVIDQGGSFWSPVSSTEVYGPNRKVVVVSRDPRGVFNSFQNKGQAYPGSDVHTFCNWYRMMWKHIDKQEWESDLVIHLRYEDITRNYREEKKNLYEFLGIPADLESEHPASLSVKNVEKFRDRLSEEQIEVIERELEDFLHF